MMGTMAFVWTRLQLAWQVLRHGLPEPEPIKDGLSAFRTLVSSPRSYSVRRAVAKVELDPSSHPSRAVKRDEALEWATTYESGSRQPWTWEHAFLVEYWVGALKGRI